MPNLVPAIVSQSHGLQRFMLVLGFTMVAIFIIVAIFAPWIAPFGFNQVRADGVRFGTQQAPSAQHWFGTNVSGTDVLSRVIWGARTAVEVIILAVVLSSVIGVPLGLISGFLGGPLDRVLVLVTDAMYAFPSLLLAIVVAIGITGGHSSALGGIMAAAISITVVFIPQYFRIIRNSTVSAKSEPYVDSARVVGVRTPRILFKHIFSNVTDTLPMIGTLNASEAVLTLAGLGFLGFGIEPSSASEWGHDLFKARPDATNGIWWTSVFPGSAIVLIVLGVTLVGESLNDILNPLLRTRSGEMTAADEEKVTAAFEQTLAEDPTSSSSPRPSDEVAGGSLRPSELCEREGAPATEGASERMSQRPKGPRHRKTNCDALTFRSRGHFPNRRRARARGQWHQFRCRAGTCDGVVCQRATPIHQAIARSSSTSRPGHRPGPGDGQ